MQLKKMTFLKADLNCLGEQERNFFIGIAHIANEINSLSRLFQWSIARPTSEIGRRAMLTQGLMFARLLNGKLYEFWIYLKKAFSNKLSKVYEPELDSDSAEALKDLRRYFSNGSMSNKVRNKFSFHYDPEFLVSGYDDIDDDALMEIYLGEHNANTIYALADDIVGRGMINFINPESKSEAMKQFFEETSMVAGLASVFIGGYMRLVIDKHLPHRKAESIEEISIEGLPDWSDVRIPYFTESPAHFYFKPVGREPLTWGQHSLKSPRLFDR
jgi:hypothetical protein